MTCRWHVRAEPDRARRRDLSSVCETEGEIKKSKRNIFFANRYLSFRHRTSRSECSCHTPSSEGGKRRLPSSEGAEGRGSQEAAKKDSIGGHSSSTADAVPLLPQEKAVLKGAEARREQAPALQHSRAPRLGGSKPPPYDKTERKKPLRRLFCLFFAVFFWRSTSAEQHRQIRTARR